MGDPTVRQSQVPTKSHRWVNCRNPDRSYTLRHGFEAPHLPRQINQCQNLGRALESDSDKHSVSDRHDQHKCVCTGLCVCTGSGPFGHLRFGIGVVFKTDKISSLALCPATDRTRHYVRGQPIFRCAFNTRDVPFERRRDSVAGGLSGRDDAIRNGRGLLRKANCGKTAILCQVVRPEQ